MGTESGYSNQKKLGSSQFKTIHSVGSDKFAENVITKGLVERNLANIAITAVSVSDDQKRVTITVPLHLAVRAGEVVRFYTGALATVELDIVEVVDANNLVVFNVMESLPQVGDEVRTAYYRTPQFDSSGSPIFNPGPIQFVLDGVDTEVEEDTVTPANSVPLPVKLLENPGPVGLVLLDFSVTNVTDVAYVQILASSPLTKKIQVFMSSGEPLYLAFGAPAAEVDQAFIIPGGNGLIDFEIPAGTRLSVKAVGAGVTVNSGLLLINLLG